MSLPGRSGGDPTAGLVQRREAADGAVPAPGAAPAGDVGRLMDEALGFFPVQVAQQGVAGASAPLPHRDVIQQSFGRHDVGGIRAQVGGEAGDAASAIGAEAYATGDTVAFRAAPDLHTAAHEAAHVVQQRRGVSLLGGVGSAGDVYEQHADRVADAVVRGESAEALLDEHAGSGGAGDHAVQRVEAGYGHKSGLGVSRSLGDGGGGIKLEFERELKEIPAIPLAPLPVELKPVLTFNLSAEAAAQNVVGDKPATASAKATVGVTGTLQLHVGKADVASFFGEGAVQVSTGISGTYQDGCWTMDPVTVDVAAAMAVGAQAGGHSVKLPVDSYELLKMKFLRFTIENGVMSAEPEFERGKDLKRFILDMTLLQYAPGLFALKKAYEWLVRTGDDFGSLFGENMGDAVQGGVEFAQFWIGRKEILENIRGSTLGAKYLSSDTIGEIGERYRETFPRRHIRPDLYLEARRAEQGVLDRVDQQMRTELTGQGCSAAQIDAILAQMNGGAP